MSLISYAQNFEDVILWRALHDVQRGNYIDIGAQEPEFDSVSCAFYKAGWRGIHVEPVPLYAARLREDRPDEKIIEAAVTDAPGPVPFFELGGLSSGRQDIAEYHSRSGHQPHTILVPTVRLDHLLDLVDGDVHWLKVDVEGMEADVLRSWGASEKRPWVLVIESTFPNSQDTTEHLWIHEVIKRGYKEAFFDGLSRYFVHDSHSVLLERLNRPANVFDGFQITSKHFSAALMRQEAEAQQKASEARIAALSLDILQIREQLKAREVELDRERASRAEGAQRSVEEINELRAQLRTAENELAVEREKQSQLEERERKSRMELASAEEQFTAERQARLLLNSELSRISRLAGVDPDDLAESSGNDQWIPAGSTYASVKSRLTLVNDQLHSAREFAIQQFVSGQRSRDGEVTFLGERIAALENEIADARSRLREAEDRSTRREADRARLQSLVDEQVSALDLMKSEAERFERQLSSIYSSRRGRFMTRLNLLPKPLPEIPASPPLRPAATAGLEKSEQTSATAQQSEMDISVKDIRHTSSLLALNGSVFVNALYRIFLKRSPDRAGRDHFIARLQAGDPKEDVLLAIAASPEARATGTNIEGLAELRSKQLGARRWSFFKQTRRAKALDARLNRLEYVIGEAHNSLIDRLERMEFSLEQIQAKLPSSASGWQFPSAREAGVYVQGVPASIKRGVSVRRANGAAEFIGELRESLQSSLEAVSLRNGR